MSNDVSRLLAGAARTIASVPYCWLATESEEGGVNVRPMGRLPADPEEDRLTVRFLADGRTRKLAEIRHGARVAVTYENLPEEGFVTAIGQAVLHDDPAEVGRRWKRGYETYFPTAADRNHALFIEVELERLELWIRGVTPEPFGLKPTVLRRDADGDWRLAAS